MNDIRDFILGIILGVFVGAYMMLDSYKDSAEKGFIEVGGKIYKVTEIKNDPNP